MQFTQQPFDINGHRVPADSLEGITRFPSFYEPFLRLTDTNDKEKRNKCIGERLLIPDVDLGITEKIDGVFCGVIGWQDSAENNHMIVRSRTELCAYPGDKIWRDNEELVEAVAPYFDRIEKYMFTNHSLTLWALCMEKYGPKENKKVDAYSFQKEVRLFGCRLFSDQVIRLFLSAEREKYDSLRRVNKHAPYLSWSDIAHIAQEIGIQTTPQFGTIHSTDLQTPEHAVLLLEKYKESITAKAGGKEKVIEGLVLWSGADYNHPKEGKTMAVYKVKFADFPASMFS